MKNSDWEGLYVNDETYEDYMNRKLLESVQHKPKEELAKYYDYEVEEEKPKEKTDWSEVTTAILVILMDAAIIGAIVFVLYVFFFGG